MKEIDSIVKDFKLSDMDSLITDIETFIEKFNNNEVVLLDVRMPFETKLWSLKFALEIPYNQLPDNLDKLPKDKIIVCICPNGPRSIMAREYLRFKGFKSSMLKGGSNELVATLKGGKAKELNF